MTGPTTTAETQSPGKTEEPAKVDAKKKPVAPAGAAVPPPPDPQEATRRARREELATGWLKAAESKGKSEDATASLAKLDNPGATAADVIAAAAELGVSHSQLREYFADRPDLLKLVVREKMIRAREIMIEDNNAFRDRLLAGIEEDSEEGERDEKIATAEQLIAARREQGEIVLGHLQKLHSDKPDEQRDAAAALVKMKAQNPNFANLSLEEFCKLYGYTTEDPKFFAEVQQIAELQAEKDKLVAGADDSETNDEAVAAEEDESPESAAYQAAHKRLLEVLADPDSTEEEKITAKRELDDAEIKHLKKDMKDRTRKLVKGTKLTLTYGGVALALFAVPIMLMVAIQAAGGGK